MPVVQLLMVLGINLELFNVPFPFAGVVLETDDSRFVTLDSVGYGATSVRGSTFEIVRVSMVGNRGQYVAQFIMELIERVRFMSGDKGETFDAPNERS